MMKLLSPVILLRVIRIKNQSNGALEIDHDPEDGLPNMVIVTESQRS